MKKPRRSQQELFFISANE